MPAKKIIVLGGGAAGVFAAIAAKTNFPTATVELWEKTDRLLSKVKISGGGRCNVTHHCFSLSELVKHYPRGGRSLKKTLASFTPKDTVEWFTSRGVPLKTEADGRVFPVSDSSQSIVDALTAELRRLQVAVQLKHGAVGLARTNGRWKLSGPEGATTADAVIVATGGSPKRSGLSWLENLGLPVVEPVPSLFTFNLVDKSVSALMGISVPAEVRMEGFPLTVAGPLLITHWGFSGPAVLRLSAFAARWLQEREYRYTVRVNWVGGLNEEAVRTSLAEGPLGSGKKTGNSPLFGLPQRLWLYLLSRAEINPEIRWTDLSKRSFNKLVSILTHDGHEAQGKTTFKEEFVTAGGIALEAVNLSTLEAKDLPGLFLAGEVLDVDGVTGGFNFQWAWASGFVAGRLGE